MVRPTMPTSTDERESFDYTIENIIKDRTRFNYWVPKNIPCFPTLYIHTLLEALSLHRVPPILPYISIHLLLSLHGHFHFITFSPHDLEYL